MQKATLQSALFRFSKEVPKIARTAEATASGGRTYRYATYDGIMSAIQPLLIKNKLYVTQTVGEKSLKTEITHSVTGEFIVSEAPIPPVRNVQELGSVITYLRRYTLSALLNLVVEDDIDGVKTEVVVVKEPLPEGQVLVKEVETEVASEHAQRAKAMLDAAKGEAREIVVEKIRASTKLTESEKVWLLN